MVDSGAGSVMVAGLTAGTWTRTPHTNSNQHPLPTARTLLRLTSRTNKMPKYAGRTEGTTSRTLGTTHRQTYLNKPRPLRHLRALLQRLEHFKGCVWTVTWTYELAWAAGPTECALWLGVAGWCSGGCEYSTPHVHNHVTPTAYQHRDVTRHHDGAIRRHPSSCDVTAARAWLA